MPRNRSLFKKNSSNNSKNEPQQQPRPSSATPANRKWGSMFRKTPSAESKITSPPVPLEVSISTPEISFVSHETEDSDPTHPVRNVTIDVTSNLLTSLICLCVLESRRDVRMVRIASMGKLLIPSHERMVRDAIRRNIAFHLSRLVTSGTAKHHDDENSSNDESTNQDLPSIGEEQVDAHFLKHMDMDKAELLVRDCLKQSDFQGAIAISKVLLAKQPSGVNAQRAETLGKLAVLCIAVGWKKEALGYSNEALKLHRANDRPLQAALSAMEVGLVHFGNNKIGQALKAWREAMQLACLGVGYEHLHVAVLLCNIGVLHFESGDVPASIRALEESLEMQRSILRTSSLNIEHSLYQMAITMGNLAMAFEKNREYERTIALLDDSRMMLGSMDCPVVQEMEKIVSDNLDRVIRVRDEAIDNANFFEGTDLPVTIEVVSEDEESVASARSAVLFGNSDGIPDSRRLAARMSITKTDIHDFILLGPLHPEQSNEERVQETMMTWFGKKVDIESIPFVAFDDMLDNSSGSNRESIPVDVDAGLVPNAELRLRQIHMQAMKHLDCNEIDDALDLFRSALHSHRAKFGHDHHLVGSALHNIGVVHLFAQQYDNALVAFEEAVLARVAALGDSHPDVQVSRMKIGLIHFAVGKMKSALQTFRLIREKFLEVLGYGHPQMAKLLNNIGVVACQMKDYRGALKAFEVAYEYQRRFSEDRENISEIETMAITNTLSNTAFVYWKLGDIAESLRLYRESLAFMRFYLDREDPKIVVVKENIEFLLEKGTDPPPEAICYNASDSTCVLDFLGMLASSGS